jgi:signal transduction histidine kinase
MDVSRNFRFLEVEDYAWIWGSPEILSPAQVWAIMDSLPANQSLAEAVLPIHPDKTYWIAFKASNYSDDTRQLMLQLKNPFLHQGVLYVRRQGGAFSEVATFGEKFPYNQRMVVHRDFLVPLTFDEWEENLYLLHVDNRSHAQLFPLFIWERSAFEAADEKISFVYGFTFGLMGLVLLYTLVFWSLFRESLLFWYAATTLTLIVYMSVQTGYSHWLFQTGNGGQLKMFLRFSAGMAMFCQVQFARLFLDIKKDSLFHPLLVGSSLVLLLLSLFIVFFPHYYYTYPIVVGNILFGNIVLCTVLIYLAGFQAAQYRKWEALVYFFAYSTFFFIGLLAFLAYLGLIPQWSPLVNSLVIGAAIEVLVIAIAMAIKFRNLLHADASAQAKEESSKSWGIEYEETVKQHIAMELHDHIGSKLSNLIRHPAWNREDASTQDVLHHLQHIYEEVRNITRMLDSHDFQHLTLSEAIYELAHLINQQKSELKIIPQKIRFPESQLDDLRKKHIYRIVAEALQNTVKHAKAKECYIQVHDNGYELIVTVEDNGIGIQRGPTKAKPFGLRSMNHRAKQVGGKLQIDSQPGKGTIVILTVPYQKRKG